MANDKHLEILSQGVKVWNEWRENNTGVIPNLTRAQLRGRQLKNINLAQADLREINLMDADLSYASFNNANLSDSNLREANLKYANLINSNLYKANFNFANLSVALLGGANLTEAILSFADLNGTNLYDANLKRADLLETKFLNTTFGNVNLFKARNLDNCRHIGPSIIDNQTLQQSGPLPDVFLKGVGLADWEIEQTKLYQRDLDQNLASDILYKVHELRFGSPIQVHNLFISYAHKDNKFVNKLGTTLDRQGTRFWRDIKNLPDAPAGPLDKVILKEMKGCVVLLILSENSISSDWVRFEMESAAKIGIDEGREVLLPIALDDSWKDYNWPLKLRDRIFDYNIIDFSQWQDETIYNQRFQQILEGLDLFYKEN